MRKKMGLLIVVLMFMCAFSFAACAPLDNSHAHDWGEWTQVLAPTCTTAGAETRSCLENAEHIQNRSVDALGHDWGDWEQTIAPTETTPGEETRVCKRVFACTEKRAIPIIGEDSDGDDGRSTIALASVSEVNSYISAKKANAVADSFSSSLETARVMTEATAAEAQAHGISVATTPPGYRSTYNKVSSQMGLNDITTWGANNNIVYPGNILKIADPDSSDMLSQIVGLERAPGKISISLEGATGTGAKSATVEDISLSSTREAISGLVNQNMTVGAQLPFMIASSITEVKSSEEISAALGMSIKGGFGLFKASASASLNTNDKQKKTYAILLLRQIYYTIDFDYPIQQGAMGFFGDVTMPELSDAIKAGDVPTYVSSVTYGRMVAITIKTDYSMEELRAKMNASVKVGSYVEANGSVSMESESELEGMELDYFVYGGSIESNQNVLSSVSQSEMINALNAEYDPLKNIGVPIAYTLSHLGDGALAKIGETSEYYVKNLEPITVQSVYFASAGNDIKSQCVVGTDNIILNAVKYPEEAMLYPLSYTINESKLTGEKVTNIVSKTGVVQESYVMGISDENKPIMILQITNYQADFNPAKPYNKDRVFCLSITDNEDFIGRKYVITAQAGDETTQIEIEIKKRAVQQVAWDSNVTDGEVAPGKTIILGARALPEEASCRKINYEILQGEFYCSLSDRELTVKPEAPDGTVVKIVAVADGVKSSALTFTVRKIAVSKVTISRNGTEVTDNAIDINRGNAVNFDVSVAPIDASFKEITYTVLSGGSYITFDPSRGRVEIKDEAPLGSIIEIEAAADGQTAGIKLRVIEDLVSSVVVDYSREPYYVGDVIQLEYRTFPLGAAVTNVNWSVVNGDGTVTVTQSGTVTVMRDVAETVKVKLSAMIGTDSCFNVAVITVAKKHVVSFENAALANIKLKDKEALLLGDLGANYQSPTKTNYVFQGWYTDSGYTELFTEGMLITKDTVLYAYFLPDTYTVTFDSNRPDEATRLMQGGMAPQPFSYGKEEKLRINEFILPGWVFKGWSGTATGTALYVDGKPVQDLGTVTLYAVWEKTVKINTALADAQWDVYTRFDLFDLSTAESFSANITLTIPSTVSEIEFLGNYNKNAGNIFSGLNIVVNSRSDGLIITFNNFAYSAGVNAAALQSAGGHLITIKFLGVKNYMRGGDGSAAINVKNAVIDAHADEVIIVGGKGHTGAIGTGNYNTGDKNKKPAGQGGTEAKNGSNGAVGGDGGNGIVAENLKIIIHGGTVKIEGGSGGIGGKGGDGEYSYGNGTATAGKGGKGGNGGNGAAAIKTTGTLNLSLYSGLEVTGGVGGVGGVGGKGGNGYDYGKADKGGAGGNGGVGGKGGAGFDLPAAGTIEIEGNASCAATAGAGGKGGNGGNGGGASGDAKDDASYQGAGGTGGTGGAGGLAVVVAGANGNDGYTPRMSLTNGGAGANGTNGVKGTGFKNP